MQAIASAVSAFFEFKAYVMLPVIVLAAGFAGIFTAARGLDYPVLDVGWPPLAAIAWSWSLAPRAERPREARRPSRIP